MDKKLEPEIMGFLLLHSLIQFAKISKIYILKRFKKKYGLYQCTATVRPRKMSREATRFGFGGFWSAISGSGTVSRWWSVVVSALISAIRFEFSASSTVFLLKEDGLSTVSECGQTSQ